MAFHKLVNTRYFSEAAIDFKKNGGMYTRAPEGSREWMEYWQIQEDRSLNGYKVGDTWITGRHYFFLNFTPISRITEDLGKALEERRNKHGKLSQVTMDKHFSFPDFYEAGYEWYRFKHIAKFGGQFMGITSTGGKHIACAKARGAGWSYMEASDGVYNYNLFDGSKSYYFAGIEQYLTTDGILNKVQPMLDWINDHSNYWKKNRQKKNTLMHQRASFVDELGVERGSMSEIVGVVVDDPNKTRGKRGMKITFEEAGSFRNLKKSLIVSMGSIKDGSYYVGQISVFGTGGEQGPSIEGLEEIFYSPEAFDMLAFPNVYEEGMEATKCGYFVPVYRVDRTFMDENGNVDVKGAVDHQLAERLTKGKARDKKVLDDYIAEYPFYPQEAFKRLGKNPFWTDRINRQIKRVETEEVIQKMIRHGYLIPEDKDKGGARFIQSDAVTPILQYPHKDADDLSGCCTMYDAPYKDEMGFTPDGMYDLVFDPFYNDDAEDQTSLFHFWIFKNPNNIDSTWEDLPVFEYCARPEDLDTCYEQLFLACELYNAKAQGEIAGGGKGVLDYAKRKLLMHRIHYRPEGMALGGDKEIETSQRNRSYLMNMTAEYKKLGITYLVQWHKEVIGITESGDDIFRIDRVYSLGFLRELLKFDGKKNADRISSAIIHRFQSKQRIHELVKQEQKKAMDEYYARQFTTQDEYETSDTTNYM